MTKIRITEQQYNNILLNEEKKRLNENNNNILLVIASLAGVELSGNNKLIADKSKQDKNIMSKVKSTLENPDKLDELVDALEQKGLKNPDKFLARNAEKIIDNYNEISDNKLDFYTRTTLHELNPK